MKYSVLVLSVVLVGCPATPPPHPPRPLPDDTASCKSACDHLEVLGCEEAKPLEDGTSCTKFCEDTQTSGHHLRPSCVMSTKTCAEIETTCAR